MTPTAIATATDRARRHWAGRILRSGDCHRVVTIVADRLQTHSGERFREAVRSDLKRYGFGSIWITILLNFLVPLIVKWLLED